jgi:hypothetical protein
MQTQTHARSSVSEPTGTRVVIRRWTGCSVPVLLLYVSFCAILAVAGFLRSLPTYDRFFYAGVIASFRYSDPSTVHRIARAEFDAQPSPFRYESVATDPYYADMHDNPYHFVQQLGFYRVKPAYIVMGYALWRAGLSILVGLRLISATCFFVVGLALLAWTHDALLSAILLLTSPVLNLGRMVTADPLSTTIIFLGLFALAKKRDLMGASFLAASVLVRVDNIVLVLIVLAWMVWRRRIRFTLGFIFGTLALAVTVLINRIANYYGWRVLIQHTFVRPEMEPASHPVLVSFAGYLHALVALRVIPYTFMTIWLFVAAAVWKRLPSGSIFRDLLPPMGICVLIRMAIFPDLDDRFFVWAYLLAGVALIQTAQAPFRKLKRVDMI